MKLVKLKSVTGGTRHQLNLKKSLLSKNNKIIKSFVSGSKKNAGRSTTNGRITVWHKGGGCKSNVRLLSSPKNQEHSAKILLLGLLNTSLAELIFDESLFRRASSESFNNFLLSSVVFAFNK